MNIKYISETIEAKFFYQQLLILLHLINVIRHNAYVEVVSGLSGRSLSRLGFCNTMVVPPGRLAGSPSSSLLSDCNTITV